MRTQSALRLHDLGNTLMLKKFKWFRDTQGSFTIEASFVLPTILLSTIALLFLAVYVFQTASAYQSAGLAADRAAFVWDNSKKDPITGAFALGEDDGLYWRLHNDSVSDLFRFVIPNRAAEISLPAKGPSGGTGPEGKLQRAAAVLASEWQGLMRYRNSGIMREVSVDLTKPFHSPTYVENKLAKDVESNAQAQVVDPVETIRLVDLTRTFIQEIQGRIEPAAALQTMVEPQTVPEAPVVINSHNSAARYLQTLVTGTEQTVQVNPTTQRVVDALDGNAVAHQAFYTFSESQLRGEQLPKDKELLTNGAVKGVVWHFFKQSKHTQVKLSAGLRQELERQGIVIVVHE
ncbi:TadE/TadG family type IV pilus assembly protein [Paenibacillus xerothermodurans]|uniref:Pilus assembly protein n=1 Tax=Paenibacillus xerothermodurans TaxID=1977292 RepID=A0A2W1NVS6_PAEXE|nr:hypothetical protein [Paenibacillus xerothermodurans]PZE21816.1 hypothetical protein CBW46_005255 [Paenibacillus xerothermodurans]